jgi:ATP-dependent DNA helicase DinG
VAKARSAAWAADLVVVNHHLLCADLALRRDADQALLPVLDIVVLDEAHAFIPTASQAFSESVSTHQYASLARDLLSAGLRLARDGAPWAELSAALEQSSLVVRSAFAPLALGKWDWSKLETEMGATSRQAITDWAGALRPIQDALRLNRERHPEIERLADRTDTLIERLTRFQAGTEALMGQTTNDYQAEEGMGQEPDRVFWLEKTKSGLSLHGAPLDLAEPLRPVFDAPDRSWIFLSATLSSAGLHAEDAAQAFSYFTRRLGIRPAQSVLVGSPFDFQQQALLVLPRSLPDPKSADLIAQLLALPGMDLLLHKIPGGVLILCTSLRAVALAAETLRRRPSQFLADRRLLVQGEASRTALLAEFRAHGRGLLIGSASFWEGVDVPGLALSMVLIDKLPFAPPDDPVMQARMHQARRRGEDPFRSIQCPEALLALKQGIGRLIRSEADRGVLLIGDRRLYETGYGRSMRAALPAFAEAGSVQEALGRVEALFATL